LEKEQKEPISMIQYAEIAEIDLDKRIFKALLIDAYEEIYSTTWWSCINDQLDDVYGKVR
jgi:hypothetical protein